MARPVAHVRLRVAPGAAWKIRVAAPAERGAANQAVLTLLAATLRVPRAAGSLVSGHAARDKMVEVEGIPPDELEACLASAERKEQRR